MRVKPTVIATVVAGAFLLAGAARSSGQSAPDTTGRNAFVRWVAARAHPLLALDLDSGPDELAPLDPLVRGARVIGVGESDHNVHEFMRLRFAILRRLVQRGEVAAIAMETGLPEAAGVDAWLVGDSSTEPPFERLLHYGYGRDLEMRQLLAWLHEQNARLPRGRRVHFYGIDLPQNGGGSMLPALRPVWSYLDRVDPAYARESRSRLEGIARALDRPGWWNALPRYDSLGSGARDTLRVEAAALAERFATNADDYRARSTPEDLAWATRLAEVVRQTELNLRDRDDTTNVRDVAMASNLEWVLGRAGGRILLLAHNLHVAHEPIEGPIVVERLGRPARVRNLGSLLSRSLRTAYVAIGTAHDLGALVSPSTPADPNAVDGVLARVGPPAFFLDLHAAPTLGPAYAWLQQPHLMRAPAGYAQVVLPRAFDAVVFVRQVRPAGQIPDEPSRRQP